MKVSEVIELLKEMPQDLEVEVNDNDGGEVYPISEITHYIPDIDLYPEDVSTVVIQINL